MTDPSAWTGNATVTSYPAASTTRTVRSMPRKFSTRICARPGIAAWTAFASAAAMISIRSASKLVSYSYLFYFLPPAAYHDHCGSCRIRTRNLCTRSLVRIEEGWRQKARQNVVVLDWGARWNATLEIFGVIVNIAVVQFPLLLFGGGEGVYVDLYFKFLNTIQ